MNISAKIVADSINSDIRITTMELCYPRFIHSEIMTHRMFSRNASSSRAIPIEKMIASVEASPAMPIHWGLNCPGMQAKEELANWNHIPDGEFYGFMENEEFDDITGESYFVDVNAKEVAKGYWECAAESAIDFAKDFNNMGLHKQIVNRILEPFQWIKVIVTATEWDNFFKLRCHADAQPEIAQLALRMKEAMEDSSPIELQHGEWHLPYVTMQYPDTGQTSENNESLEECIKMSVARCARVSYLNHDNTSPDIAKDIALADKLLEAGHMSPFEHIATPMKPNKEDTYYSLQEGVTHIDRNGDEWSGNFRGFLQYRQLLNGL